MVTAYIRFSKEGQLSFERPVYASQSWKSSLMPVSTTIDCWTVE